MTKKNELNRVCDLDVDARPSSHVLLECVLIFSFVERPSLPAYQLALVFHIQVPRVTRGMTHSRVPLAFPASPEERPRLHQFPQTLTRRHLPTSPVRPLEAPSHPMEKTDQELRRRHSNFPASRTSSGRTGPCPNLNRRPFHHRRCSKRF